MTSPRRRWSFGFWLLFVVVTLLAALFSWLLFELWRMPYRAPDDMTTALGTERNIIPFVIALVAICWTTFAIWCYATHQTTIRDVLTFTLLFGILLAVGVPIIKSPPWPVAAECLPATQPARLD